MRIVLAFFSFVYLLVVVWHFGQIVLGVKPDGSIGLLRELTLYLFLPAPFLLIGALLARARVAIFLALLPVALFVALYAPRFVPRPQPAAAGPTFRVMTFNAGAGAGGGEAPAVLSAVEAAQPDVIAVQEVPAIALRRLSATLAEQYPYQAMTQDVATFSVYPLVEPIEIRLKESGYVSQAVDILLADRVVRLTNVHLQRAGPRIGGRRSFAAFVRDYEPRLLEDQVNEIVERYIGPVGATQLLTGDFNQTEWSRPYELLAEVLRDSFKEAGRGFGHTFPSAIGINDQEVSLPLVRIDYIFHSADLAALRSRVGPGGGSDHLPVFADLAFR